MLDMTPFKLNKLWAIMRRPVAGQDGFVLVISLFVLVVLTVIGISATKTTDIELRISGNDKVITQTFYQADGAIETAINMIEENLSCPNGFSGDAVNNNEDLFLQLQAVEIADLRFAYDEVPADVPHAGFTGALSEAVYSTDDVRSIRICIDSSNPNDTDPHSNMTVYGITALAPGSAIQMASGYEGKGHGVGGGGAYLAEKTYSRHYGKATSETLLHIEWKHMVGQEGVCRY